MVMTCHHTPPSTRLVLLVLLSVTPRLAGAAPAWAEGGEGGAEGRSRTDAQEDRLAPLLPPQGLGGNASRDQQRPEQGTEQGTDQGTDEGTDPAQVLAVLLRALDRPGEGPEWTGGPEEDDLSQKSPESDKTIRSRQSEAEPETHEAIEEPMLGRVTAALGEDFERDQNGRVPGDADREGEEEKEVENFLDDSSQGDDASLRRKIRGYFQNIDLGLQDNEILPPLKGYKAYNTQLARAGKKLHWQENGAADRPAKGDNFMDDFEDEGGELEEEVEEEDESLTRMEEEARARAEKQEVLQQQEEAERAREEEQRLADIASDMLLQYMGRKQQAFMKPRQKSSNTAEDKRSEEVLPDEDDLDQQMIDRLIEISSKLHLPADDVIEIISDVEEKKKKRKELLQQQPLIPGKPVIPRFRPLVPPPLAAPPVYHYTASKNPKKAPYKHNKYNKSMKKWQKDKVKSYKQNYWYQPPKQIDYWYKPQKQFLAFPSYPYYQKPYRAYYPVYFPYPKAQYYGKPSPARDQPFSPQELDLQGPKRRHRVGGKNRGQGWRQRPAPRLPVSPYISNYILPHPRTYQPLPPPKPPAPPRRSRRPPYYYPHATQANDYEEDGLVPQLDSEEELENFIERIYMKRRMY
ncbi:neurosecretory protein VGF [Nerophis ophidion]|uniref:neurosecretory protein VGF n=1 Tax=Nerophis ophidion TaxID=159077 RepID=UPI002AE08FC2|nr:neurosecretory protein VGF [Nerophis ophidion]XP_061746570.1 neurosecretory protein VGF [Nerophis ophidion]